MINGFDINPLVTTMHLNELEKEIARARAAGAHGQATSKPVERLHTRIADWFRRRGVAQRPDPASSFLPT